jgi:serine/threonine protein phosphatase PrpC
MSQHNLQAPAVEGGALDPDRSSTPTSARASQRRIRSESSTHAPENLISSTKASFAAVSDEAMCSMIHYGVSSEQGARKTMEDQHVALCESNTVPFFGVYDGHGGTHCAEYLKAHLHDYVLQHPKLREDPELAMREAIQRAETEFMEKCRQEKIESGSTAALALILDGKLVTANVGDSEIVLSRKGEAVLLTTKHQLGSNEKEVERVKNCGGRIYHSRVGHPKFNPQLVSLAVSRAIGDAGFKLEEFTDGKSSGIIADADTKLTELTKEDEFMIIGCDGLYDVMNYQECVGYCRHLVETGVPSQKISEAIVSEALQRGSTDNVTVLFVQLQAPKLAAPSAPTTQSTTNL